MKLTTLAAVTSALIGLNASAMPMDIMGGPDSTTQTMHHCGYLPTTEKRYTTTALTTKVVERKLSALGYNAAVDGKLSKHDIRAVKKFQSDYGLKADGVVGPLTAQRLAFVGHPSSHVRGCDRMARN